ncbi:hypothetical protein M426DRAFT_96036 [Hypoxylon sp. CI-4A]|nr:hypothetical protein M426DRAFT_96036 [Hypoxylon sp. CI-4A]
MLLMRLFSSKSQPTSTYRRHLKRPTIYYLLSDMNTISLSSIALVTIIRGTHSGTKAPVPRIWVRDVRFTYSSA